MYIKHTFTFFYLFFFSCLPIYLKHLYHFAFSVSYSMGMNFSFTTTQTIHLLTHRIGCQAINKGCGGSMWGNGADPSSCGVRSQLGAAMVLSPRAVFVCDLQPRKVGSRELLPASSSPGVERCAWPSVMPSFSITGGSLKDALSFGKDSPEKPLAVCWLPHPNCSMS